jgi:arylsulfatase A-like enzyme
MKRALILVTVDCLRADHVGFLGYSRPVTPFLDSLATESVVFSNAMAAGAPTYFSFPAILASRYPLALGREVLGIAPGEPTIATVLHASGWKTAALLAANPYLSPRFGYDQRFETFEDFLDKNAVNQSLPLTTKAKPFSAVNRSLDSISHKMSWTGAAYDELYFWYCQWRSADRSVSMQKLRRYPSADVIIERACQWLATVERDDFFLWIHLMDPHHPYYPPEEAVSSLKRPDLSPARAQRLNALWNRGDISPERLRHYRDEIVALYDAGVSWADRQIGRLVDSLKSLGQWENSIFAVTADHGEEFLEHGVRYHSPTHLPEELIHVPLLLRNGAAPGARRIQEPVSLIHLAPTLLECADVAVPTEFQGRGIWADVVNKKTTNEVVVTEVLDRCTNPFRVEDRMRSRILSVRDDRYKLTINFTDNRESFVDLEAGEQQGVSESGSTANSSRRKLLQAAYDHVKRSNCKRNVALALRARVHEFQSSSAMGPKRIATSSEASLTSCG